MKIYEKEIMILKVEEKTKSTDNSKYLSIGFACIEDGTTFTVSSTDLTLINVLQPFTQRVASFTIADSKYGIRITLESVV